MKTAILKIALILALLTTMEAGCKKDADTDINTGINTDTLERVSNIILYDKPLEVIQFYIRGEWQLDYYKGGFASNTIQYYDSVFWKFPSAYEVLRNMNGKEVDDYQVYWYKEQQLNTYSMNIILKGSYVEKYFIDGIYNDSLVIHDSNADRIYYHFARLQ